MDNLWLDFGDFKSNRCNYIKVMDIKMDIVPRYIITSEKSGNSRGYDNFVIEDALVENRTIKVGIMVYREVSDSDYSFNRKISSALNYFSSKKKQILKISTVPSIQYNGVVTINNDNIKIAHDTCYIELVFSCDYYGEQLNTSEDVLLWSDTVRITDNVPLVWEYDYNKSLTSNFSDTLNYKGTIDVFPVIKLSINSCNGSLKFSIGSNTISIANVYTNSVVVIDGINQVVSLNGIEITHNVTLFTEFPKLVNGNNKIKCLGASGKIELDYKDRYEYTELMEV